MIARIILTSASVIALTASAAAGDLFPEIEIGGKDGAAPYANGTGQYIGVDVGGAWNTAKMTGFVPPSSDMNSTARALAAVIDNGSAQNSASLVAGT